MQHGERGNDVENELDSLTSYPEDGYSCLFGTRGGWVPFSDRWLIGMELEGRWKKSDYYAVTDSTRRKSAKRVHNYYIGPWSAYYIPLRANRLYLVTEATAGVAMQRKTIRWHKDEFLWNPEPFDESYFHQDGFLFGYGGGVGCNLALFLTDHISVQWGVNYRIAWMEGDRDYGSETGEDVPQNVREQAQHSTFHFQAGLSLHLQAGRATK
ncbi:hypothetical protein GF324_13925 [bacterium]|nr:hypothetical protein [bacterium]